MNRPTLAPRRPIRAAAIAAAIVALWGSFWCLVGEVAPGRCLLFMACYGILLSGGVIGVLLASHYRVTRWWMACYLLVFAAMVVFGVVANRFPRMLLESVWLLKVIYGVIVAWLLSGCLLAVLGWWSYVRRVGPAGGNDRLGSGG